MGVLHAYEEAVFPHWFAAQTQKCEEAFIFFILFSFTFFKECIIQ